jgi:ATP-binding cassette subfamily B (MDR/TAP) protein 1
MDNEDSVALSGTAIAAAVDEKHAISMQSGDEEAKPATAGLSDQEKDIIEKQTSAPNLTVGYFSLFRYANGMDRLVMVGALIASIAAGAVMPLMTVSNISHLLCLEISMFARASSAMQCYDTSCCIPYHGRSARAN